MDIVRAYTGAYIYIHKYLKSYVLKSYTYTDIHI